MNTDTHHPAARLAHTDAINALHWAPRIDRALTELARARSPLKASTNGPGAKNNISDPTGNTATNPHHHNNPDQLRHNLLNALHQRDQAANTINQILDNWAANPTDIAASLASVDNMWCENHRAHQEFVPRKTNGARHCSWCVDVHANYGKLPNTELVRIHGQGRRISDHQYRTLLADKGKRTRKGKAA